MKFFPQVWWCIWKMHICRNTSTKMHQVKSVWDTLLFTGRLEKRFEFRHCWQKMQIYERWIFCARTPCIAVVCLNYNNKHYTVLQVILCVRASKCVLLCVFVCTVLCTNSLADIKYLWITEENNKNKPSQPTRPPRGQHSSKSKTAHFPHQNKYESSFFRTLCPTSERNNCREQCENSSHCVCR